MALRHSRQAELFSRKSRKRRKLKQDPADRRRLQLEGLEDRLLLTTGPQLIGIQPNDGSLLNDGDLRDVAPSDLTFRFDENAVIDTDTLGAIQLTGAGADGVLDTSDDVVVTPGFLGLGETTHEVIMRFAQPLPDDRYRIDIDGTTAGALRDVGGEVFNSGEDFSREFELDLGAQVLAIVPQPVERVGSSVSQRRDQIVIYFNDDNLDPTSAQNPDFYQLYYTGDTATNTDDQRFIPDAAVNPVVYDSVANTVTLTFSQPIDQLPVDGGGTPVGFGTFRLRIGTDEAQPLAPNALTPGTEPGDSFATANTDIGTLTSQSLLISQEIENPTPYELDFPGSEAEPGHRDIEPQNHLLATQGLVGITTPGDSEDGISTIFYNFREIYGVVGGQPVKNVITENQKQRTREVFELYSEYLGAEFIESDSDGFTIVTGDMRVVDSSLVPEPGGTLGVAGVSFLPDGTPIPIAVMDAAETPNWDDEFGQADGQAEPGKVSWFEVAMHEIGHLLGMGHTDELGPITVMNDAGALVLGNRLEPDYPGDHDVTHGRYLFRPESNDIDLYRFTVGEAGVFSAEILAERQPDASLLDSRLALYQVPADDPDNPILVAQNDDYFSEDSFLSLELEAGDYFVGVSASLNNDYDPTIEDTGIGGTSQGEYDLRLIFRPNALVSIVDTDNTPTAFDGDNDGRAGGVHNFWFRAAPPVGSPEALANPDNPRTVFVYKDAATGGDGSENSPVNSVDGSGAGSSAFDIAREGTRTQPGDIVRIVASEGVDNDLATLNDNEAYEFGFTELATTLEDGDSLTVPQGVTVMVDEGTVFKFRNSFVVTGSTNLDIDRSQSAFQVLGTPNNSVYFTSLLDEEVGKDDDPGTGDPGPEDWGGIIYQQDKDRAEGRFLWERRGIFLDHVNHADIKYGGGTVLVDGQARTPSAIDLTRARPTISQNTLTFNARAAIAADPDSFEETNFHSPTFQTAGAFTSDYVRVGPDIDGNFLDNNSQNGMRIRVLTGAGQETAPMTVSGRWDDISIAHILTDKLEVRGTAGGPRLEETPPPAELVTLDSPNGAPVGSLAGTFDYRLTFIDAKGVEGPASDVTGSITVGTSGAVTLGNLPPVAGSFVARRLYRQVPGTTDYEFVQQIDGSDLSYIDDGVTEGGLLDPQTTLLRARLDARLAIDPRTVVKSEGGRIEVTFGAQLLAEGLDGEEVIFTSLRDDRFGAAGTFDTDNNDVRFEDTSIMVGDWGGLWIGQASTASIDNALLTFGGGVVRVEETFNGFNVLEIHQAQARVTNTVFEFNDVGVGGQGDDRRNGRGFNEEGTLFVRHAQPVLLNNTIRSNEAAAMNINVNALNSVYMTDFGRSIGAIDREIAFRDNQGPLIRNNQLDNNAINGLVIRGETMTTEGVWDDTDMVHVLFDRVNVPDFHTYGGLRLESSATQSLVVKLSGDNAGITTTGRPLDIDDRIGGALRVVGQPGSPVVFTSLADDSVGAGFTSSDGEPQTDTNNDGDQSLPMPGDWGGSTGQFTVAGGILIDQYSHDRNVETILEEEPVDAIAPGPNSSLTTPQVIGELAPSEYSGDENRRLGFSVFGTLTEKNDIDVYSFNGTAGTEVWFDVDKSRHALDVVLDVIDSEGNVIARSDNSADLGTLFRETLPSGDLVDANGLGKGTNQGIIDFDPLTGTGSYDNSDYWTTNPRDAGMRVVLTGTKGTPSTFYVRVRSSSPDLNDINAGLTSGPYELQMRLREVDEVPGTTVRYADIRYAVNGIHVKGQPIHSPFAGEVAEAPVFNDDVVGSAQFLGNLLNTDMATLSIAGEADISGTDVDVYEFSIEYDSIQDGGGVPLPLIFDLDYADQLGRADFSLYVFDSDGNLILTSDGVNNFVNSNVAEDLPTPLEEDDLDNLSQGSVGVLDPMIGVTNLLPGNYFLAVTPVSRMPAQMDQFFTADATNPLVRLSPLAEVDRIAVDRVDGGGPILDIESVVPFDLSDVTLFVSQGTPSTAASLSTIDPFTGASETFIGELTQSPILGDIALRWDGSLFGFTGVDVGASSSFLANQAYVGTQADDATSGNLLLIDTGDASTTLVADDDIETWQVNPEDGEEQRAGEPTQTGVGILVNALTFNEQSDENLELFAVGDRGDEGTNTALFERNLLYQYNQFTGDATSSSLSESDTLDRTGCPDDGNECRFVGAGTQVRERGVLSTDIAFVGPPVVGSAEIPEVTDPTSDASTPAVPGNPTNYIINDGEDFGIRSGGPGGTVTTFEFDAGKDLQVDVADDFSVPGIDLEQDLLRDGNFFSLDSQDVGAPGFYQFDTGGVLAIDEPAGTNAGERIVDQTQLTIVTPTSGRIFELDNTDIPSTPTPNTVQIPFQTTDNAATIADAIRLAVEAVTDAEVTVISGTADQFVDAAQVEQAVPQTIISFDIDTQDDVQVSVSEEIFVNVTHSDGTPGTNSYGVRQPYDTNVNRGKQILTLPFFSAAPDVPSVLISDVQIVEGTGGTNQADFEITLSNVTDVDVVLDLTTADGPLGPNGATKTGLTPDYSDPVTTQVTISAGSLSVTYSVPVVTDSDDEGIETFQLAAVEVSGPGVITTDVGVATIVDDDGAPNLLIDDVTARESEDLDFELRLAPELSGRAQASTANTITLAASTSLADDALNGMVVKVVSGAGASEQFTILDYDGATDVVTIDGTWTTSPDATSKYEIIKPAIEDITVKLRYVDGTAQDGVNYTSTPFATIPAGQISGTFSVATLETQADQTDTDFTVEIEGVTVGQVNSKTDTALGTILDNDSAEVIISSPIIDEAASSVTFDVELSYATTSQVVLELATMDGTAQSVLSPSDFLNTTGLVFFNPGDTSTTFEVPIVPDSFVEVKETFDLMVSSVFTAGIQDVGVLGVGTATIIDNDHAGVDSATVEIDDVTVNELDGVAEFTVSLDKTVSSDVTLTMSLTDVTTTSGSDYTVPALLDVTIPANTVSATFTVPIIADGILDDSTVTTDLETFTVGMTSVTSAATIDITATGTGTIVDDDYLPEVTISNVSVAEDDGDVTFDVDFSRPFSQGLTLSLQVVNGTAIFGSDYTLISSTTLNVPAGTTSDTYTLSILDDTISELTEDLFVNLNNVVITSNGTPVIGQMTFSNGTGEIIDNDAPDVVINDVMVNEGFLAVFDVELTAPTIEDVTLTLQVGQLGDTALGGVDYQIPVNLQVTIPAGATSTVLEVQVDADALIEGREEFTVSVASVDAGSVNNIGDVGVGIISDVLPQPSAGETGLNFVVLGTGLINDGDFFTVSDGTDTATFEFNDPSINTTVGNGRIRIDVEIDGDDGMGVAIPVSSVDQIRAAMINAINLNGPLNLIAVTPRSADDPNANVIHVGGSELTFTSLTPLTPALEVTGRANGFVDGQEIVISTGAATLTMELDYDDNVRTGNVAIPFGVSDNNSFLDITNAINTAIAASSLVVNPQLLDLFNFGNPDLGGAMSLHSGINPVGGVGEAPIVRALPGGSIGGGFFGADGRTMTVDVNGSPVEFEYDNDNVLNSLTTIPISISGGDPAQTVAEKTIRAIEKFTHATGQVSGEFFVINGQNSAVEATGGVSEHTLYDPGTTGMDIQLLKDYLPNPQNTYPIDNTEGLLRGYEETFTATNIGEALTQGIDGIIDYTIPGGATETRTVDGVNVPIDITGATNSPITEIRVTAGAHSLNDDEPVYIRGVEGNGATEPGQFRANGLFQATVVNADTFDIDIFGTGRVDQNYEASLEDFVFHNFASSDGDRLNFIAVEEADFGAVPVFNPRPGSDFGVSPNSIQVPLLADATGSDVAEVMAQIINRELIVDGVFAAQAVGASVAIIDGAVDSLPISFTNNGVLFDNIGEDGRITGIAMLNGRMFAVADQGGFYEVENFRSTGGARAEFITLVGDGAGNALNFAGLVTGPDDVEGGAFSDLLFGITEDGRMVALNTVGAKQPIFVDGQDIVQTGLTNNVTGLAFSNLDVNLWHFTANRGDNPGHSGTGDPNSIWFGFESNVLNGISGPELRDDAALGLRQIENTYNFAGGAHGTLESNTFSLKGYAAEDDPVLYFTYFADTEDVDLFDWARVFIDDGTGTWSELASNSSAVGQSGNIFDNDVNGVRPDNWRQTRISLGAFAGLDNLRLRFHFSTAGESNLGDPNTVGTELRGVDGAVLRDGEQFTIDATVFEIELGFTTVTPNAQTIADGHQVLIDGTAFTFQRTPGGANVVLIDDGMDAEEVSAALVAAFNAAPVAGVTPHVNGNRVNWKGAGIVGQTGGSVFVEGNVGTQFGGLPVDVHAGMDELEVADEVRIALADAFAGGDISLIKHYREVNRIIGHTVVDAGPLRVSDELPFFIDDEREGSVSFFDPARGQNNVFEGFYIDDIVIGFAERGEAVSGSTNDASFIDGVLGVAPPAVTGPYDVEIRRSTQLRELAYPVDTLAPPPIGTIDTNDRLNNSIALVIPSADMLIDGQTFTLSDGIETLTFEYEDVDLNNGVAQGNVQINFDATFDDLLGVDDRTPEPDFVIAGRVRDAINSAGAQSILDISAATSDGDVDDGISTSNIVHLFANTGNLRVRGEQEREKLNNAVVTAGVEPSFNFGDVETIRYGVTLVRDPLTGLVIDEQLETFFQGDENTFRPQGQMIITSNIVTNSSQFGINVDAGARDRSDLVPLAGTDLPHSGPTRQLREVNIEGVIPGVVIENNLLATNQQGGIRYSGDSNAVGSPNPLGRIVNNTIFGDTVVQIDSPDVDIVFAFDVSDTMTDIITTVQAQVANLDAALVAAGLNPNYGLVEFPVGGSTSNDPRLTQDLTDFTTFTAVGGPFATLTTGGDVERGSVAVNEAFNDFDVTTTVNYRTGSKPVVILISDEPDSSANADFQAADTNLAANNGLLHAIVDPALGNTQATYGTLAANSGGTVFDINDLEEDPAFFSDIVDGIVESLTGTVFGAGILVENNARPTLLNNIVSNLSVGIDVDTSSSATIIGGTVYKGNNANISGTTPGIGDFPQLLGPSDPLFVNAADGNFYPAPGAAIIDSSVDGLEENAEGDLGTVKGPLAIGLSPILAPDRDVTGQKRAALKQADEGDPGSGGGVGEDPFIDRGALDRIDNVGPTAILINPFDNDSNGVDLNPEETSVILATGTVLSSFEILLVDGVPPADEEDGLGVDDNTVRTEHVQLFRNGELLVDTFDYSFSYNATSDTIRLTPLAGIWPEDATYVIVINSSDRFVAVPSAGADIEDGDQFEVTDEEGFSRIFEFDSGYSMQVPQTITLLVPEEPTGPSGITDGESFSVSFDGGTPIVFEFDLGDGVTEPNIEIDVDINNDDQAAVAASILAALESEEAESLGLSPKLLGDGQIHLGTSSVHTVNTASTVVDQVGQADGINEGETFTIDDGTKITTFEFNNVDIDDMVGEDNVKIDISLSETNEEIAATISNVLSGAGVGVDVWQTDRGAEPSPTPLGGGLIHVGGTVDTVLDVSGSDLTQSGRPGVTPPFGFKLTSEAGVLTNIEDGGAFTLSDGLGNSQRFEFDDGDGVPLFTTAIPFDANSTVDSLADTIITEVTNSGLGFTPTKIYQEAGLGAIALGGDEDHTLSIETLGLEALGAPGDLGAVRVVISPIPSFDEAAVAASIVNAINGSNLEEVTAALSAQGLPGQFTIEGSVNFTDFDKNFTFSEFRGAIKDLAGNEIKPNQLNGQTLFTIGVGVKPTAVDDSGFFVDFGGTLATTPPQSVLANDEGIQPMVADLVTTTVHGTLTFNPDGTFTYVHNGTSTNLTDVFTYTVTDASGTSTPGTVTINVNPPPPPLWQNPSVVDGVQQIWDVNDSGQVTLLDALLVVNLVNRFPAYALAGGLPSVPTDLNGDGSIDPVVGQGLYPDVNGDGSANLIDVLAVVNRINQLQNGNPPGSPEGEASLTVTAQVPTTDVTDVVSAADVGVASYDAGLVQADQPVAEPPVPAAEEQVAAVGQADEATSRVNAATAFDPVAAFEDALDHVARDVEQAERDEHEVDAVFGALTDEDLFGFRK
ncbi:MAG: hypothetical protein CL681_10895 [Blastopirellula sp.]|nr:hypothetical protein [Blastopirellula sp.]